MVWLPLSLVPWIALGSAFDPRWNDGEAPAQIPVMNTPTAVSHPYPPFMADPALPTVDLGYTKHKAVPNVNAKLFKFQNIRYAEPPVGDLRFKAPQPPKPGPSGQVEDGSGKKECLQATIKWTKNFPDDQDCDGCECCLEEDEEGSCKTPCSDNEPSSTSRSKSILGGFMPNVTDLRLFSEDCLYLDVWSPKKVFNGDEKVPVFVWIYGGAYIFGGKSLYFPGGLMERSMLEEDPGVIFVSMNYRMGALGFAAGKDIDDKDVNAGILDQRQALKWVREHIGKFGGDPEAVTIAGLSAGGGSVIHHLTAYGGEGDTLFKRAISFSGGWQPVTNKTTAEATFQDFMKLAGAKNIGELRQVSEDKIRQANYNQIYKAPPGTFLYNPTAWGDLAPQSPSKLLADGKFHYNAQVLLSHVTDEGGKFTNAFQEHNTTLKDFVSLALPDIEEDEREWVLDEYGYGDEPDHVKIGRVIGDVTFRCPLVYVSDAMHGGLYRQKWNTIKSNGHGGDLLYLFYKPIRAVRSVRSALILQDYAVNFALYGIPFTSVRNPLGFKQPEFYWPHGKDRKVQHLDSGKLNVPVVERVPVDNDEYNCRIWQSFGST